VNDITKARFDVIQNLAIPYPRQTAQAPLSNQAREGRAWAYPLTELLLTRLLMGYAPENIA
jgi:hypothetical protein